ncbi:MAG: PD-(D/E)XK nuclease family protein, partial [Bdellovibrionota bacterium]
NHKFVFRGTIDRVDHFKDGALIFDYKSSRTQVSNFSTWMANDQLQLLFYDWGLNQESMGALFYVLKDLKKDKGFLRESADAVPEEISSKAMIDDEALENLRFEFRERLQMVVDILEGKNWSAIPKDRKSCVKCSWKKTCRATHLVKI